MERGNGVGFCMGPRFVNIDHDTPLLLPPNLRDWVPSDPLSHFILDAVDQSVSARMIAGDSHPDHDTLCAFRRNNLALINESFVRVLEMAAELKILKVGQRPFPHRLKLAPQLQQRIQPDELERRMVKYLGAKPPAALLQISIRTLRNKLNE